MKKLYEITDEIKQIEDLFCNAVDENGDPRDLNQEEKDFLEQCFSVSETDLREKLDNYGKLISNLKAQASVINAEKETLKAELDRLSKRAKAADNRVEYLKGYILWAFKNLKIDKVKTALYTVSVKNNPVSISAENVNLDNFDAKFIKRELSKSMVQQAIKDGEFIVADSGAILKKDGELIDGLKAVKTQSISIR